MDNLNTVKKSLEIKPIERVLLTNVGSIDKKLMNRMNSFLFTGKNNVPQNTGERLIFSEIEMEVFVEAASKSSSMTGLNVFVRFAWAASEKLLQFLQIIDGADRGLLAGRKDFTKGFCRDLSLQYKFLENELSRMISVKLVNLYKKMAGGSQ